MVAANDAQAYWDRATDVLGFGVPGGAGFSLGLAAGVGGTLGKVLAGMACQIRVTRCDLVLLSTR